MQDYTGLYMKSIHKNRPPQKINECNLRAEAKHVQCGSSQVVSRDWTASRNSSHV